MGTSFVIYSRHNSNFAIQIYLISNAHIVFKLVDGLSQVVFPYSGFLETRQTNELSDRVIKVHHFYPGEVKIEWLHNLLIKINMVFLRVKTNFIRLGFI